MKKILTLSVLALFCLMIGGVSHDAEAKRFGGGSSFGKSPSTPHAAPAGQGFSQKQSAAGAASPARGGMMGMLGGLVMGGLLGALLFGGAFDGINFADILIVALIGFAIFWFMRKKSTAAKENYAYAGHPSAMQQDTAHEDPLMASDAAPMAGHASVASPDIDAAHFVPAAKDIFLRMQASWDAKNMGDIRTFCTAEVASRIELDMKALGDTKTKTEVAMMKADLLGGWVESDYEWASVQFTVLLKEETLSANGEVIESESHDVNETWIFRHAPKSEDPTWYLAGIQQQGE